MTFSHDSFFNNRKAKALIKGYPLPEAKAIVDDLFANPADAGSDRQETAKVEAATEAPKTANTKTATTRKKA